MNECIPFISSLKLCLLVLHGDYDGDRIDKVVESISCFTSRFGVKSFTLTRWVLSMEVHFAGGGVV